MKHKLRKAVVVAVAVHHERSKKKKNGPKATNKSLKQATSKGRVQSITKARNAPTGFAPLPASVATLPPGKGPSMSSGLIRGEGGNPTPKVRFGNGTSKKRGTDVYSLATAGGGNGNTPFSVVYPNRKKK